MKRMMSIAAIALFVAGSSVFACDSCGCTAKAEKRACAAKEGKACGSEKKCEKKQCAEGCEKKCCASKADKE